jgi:hypothetical protein
MDILNIIYYTIENDSKKTLSLRSLCMKDENSRLEAIFYAVKDSNDAQDLLEKLSELLYEHIEFEFEERSYIRFKVIDAYGNTNHLKLQKQKAIHRRIKNEND